MAETDRQIKAYNTYRDLGKDRSYRKVADITGYSLTAINRWSHQYHWKERIEQRDQEIHKELWDATEAGIVEDMKQYRKIIKSSIGNYVNRLKDGYIKIDKPKDLIKLIELDLKMAEIMEKKSEGTNDKVTADIVLENLMEQFREALNNEQSPESEQ